MNQEPNRGVNLLRIEALKMLAILTVVKFLSQQSGKLSREVFG